MGDDVETITRNQINQDMNMLIGSLQDEDRPIVSPLAAMRLSITWPLLCIAAYSASVLWLALNYVPESDAFGNPLTFFSHMGTELDFFAFSFIFGIAISTGLYVPSLVYLSIPASVRNQSIILLNLKRLVKRLAVASLIINMAVAVAACTYNEILIGAAPFVLILSFIVMQVVISAEVTRYGIGGMMKKLTTLAKKI